MENENSRMPSYFSNRLHLYQNFLKEKIMNPIYESQEIFHQRKLLQLVKLDFLYDLNAMKMRIEDLLLFLKETNSIFEDNEALMLQGIIYYLKQEYCLREEAIKEIQSRIPFNSKLLEMSLEKEFSKIKNLKLTQKTTFHQENEQKENRLYRQYIDNKENQMNIESRVNGENLENKENLEKIEYKENKYSKDNKENIENKEESNINKKFFLMREENIFKDERQNLTNEIYELNRFISKLEKEIDELKAKNLDLMQRNIDYSEDLARKHEQNMEIERLKKIIEKTEFENNYNQTSIKDTKIDEIHRVLLKREEEIAWLHKQLQEVKFHSNTTFELKKNDNDNNEVKDSFLAIIHFLRESLIELVFEIYILSINQGYHRNKNSLIIFEINVSNLKKVLNQNYALSYVYLRMKQILKTFFPNYAKSLINQSEKSSNTNNEFRNQFNDWILNNLKEISNQKIYDKTIKDTSILHLFKLLSLLYRIKYPIHGKSLKVDLDIKIRLEHKICASFLKIFAKETNE